MLYFDSSSTHHETGAATVTRQAKSTQKVIEVVIECINPFSYQDTDLVNIITGETGTTEILKAVDLKAFASKKGKKTQAILAKEKLTNEVTMLKRALLCKREVDGSKDIVTLIIA